MTDVPRVLWLCDSCYRGCMVLSCGSPDDEVCPLQLRTHWYHVPDPPMDDRDMMDRPYEQEVLDDYAEA